MKDSPLFTFFLPIFVMYFILVIGILDRRFKKGRGFKGLLSANPRDFFVATIILDIVALTYNYEFGNITNSIFEFNTLSLVLLFFHLSLYFIIFLRFEKNEREIDSREFKANSIAKFYIAILLLFSNAYTVSKLIQYYYGI